MWHENLLKFAWHSRKFHNREHANVHSFFDKVKGILDWLTMTTTIPIAMPPTILSWSFIWLTTIWKHPVAYKPSLENGCCVQYFWKSEKLCNYSSNRTPLFIRTPSWLKCYFFLQNKKTSKQLLAIDVVAAAKKLATPK